jgi:anti-sigma-K factor RskA
MTPARGSRGGDHEAFDELAVGWALHALEPEDEALFGLHLPDCTRCARTVAETSEVMATLAADLPPAEPSEDLRERIRSAVEETEQVRSPALPPAPPVTPFDDGPARPVGGPPTTRQAASAAWRPRRIPTSAWRGRRPLALVAAAAALVVGLGVWNVVLSTSRQQAEQTALQQQHIVDSLLAPGQATIASLSDHDGHRVATVVARHGRIQVVTSGLEVNDEASTTYVVWGMRQASPVPLGTFDVVRPRLDLRTVGSDRTGLDGFSGYAISLEPGRKAPAKPTRIVANGQVTS